MKQSRRMSIMEVSTNVFIGYCLAVLTQIVVFPWFGIETAITDNLYIGLVFTAVAIIRGYCIRRFFELWRT